MIYDWKRGDTRVREGNLTRKGKPVPLIGATAVLMLRSESATGHEVTSTLVVIDAPKGRWRYVPQPEDVGVAGLYRGEIEVTFSDGTKETFPNKDFFYVKIGDDLGP